MSCAERIEFISTKANLTNLDSTFRSDRSTTDDGFVKPRTINPIWVLALSWIFLLIYVSEFLFRLYMTKPTSAFFRKRFYVFDLLIVSICGLLQIFHAVPAFASAIHALRLSRLL